MSYKKQFEWDYPWQNLCTEVSCKFQILGSSKINLTARIPKTEIYSILFSQYVTWGHFQFLRKPWRPKFFNSFYDVILLNILILYI